MISSQNNSERDISITNPYEGVSRFIQDSEEGLRPIDDEELDDLRNMYDDFLELSSRYDDQKTERDDILTSITDNFLSIPELKQQSGFEFTTSIDEEEYQASKFRTLFSLLRKAYNNGSATASFNLPDEMKDNTDNYIQNIELTQNQNEAKNIIKALENSVENKKEEIRLCKEATLEAIENIQLDHKKINKQNQLYHKRDVGKLEDQLSKLKQDISNLNYELNIYKDEDKFLLNNTENLDDNQIKKKVKVLEREYAEIQEKLLADQMTNMELINELNEKLDENAYTIAQLKQSGGQKFNTKIAAMSSTFKKSSIGKLLNLDKIPPKGTTKKDNLNKSIDNTSTLSKNRSKSTTSARNNKSGDKKGSFANLLGIS